MATFGNGRRVAIVAGVRTPFAKAGTAFKSISAIDLGKLCVAELLQRTNLDGKEVQALVFGTVVPSVLSPNIAREVSLLPLLPKGVQSYSVSRACASANQAITDAADQIALGHIDVAIAGGSESLSNIPVLYSQGFAEALVLASKAKSFPARLKALARIRPRDLVPVTPAIAEPSTGETMGQSAEKMAKLNAIAREMDQSELAKSTEAERAEVLLRALRGTEVLLVLDNLETLSEPDRDQLFSFLNRLPHGCNAIVTSRRRADVSALTVRLDRLDRNAAVPSKGN
jgi:acetyl-CoA acyltransferase